MRRAQLTAALSLVATIALCNVLPLWLDEILQLIETRRTSTAEMIARLPLTPGAAPLGYLAQQATLRITGYSVRRARLPSAIFGAAAVFTAACLGIELGINRSWIGSALFAILPLTLRYGTESRGYSLALFLSVLATLIYVRLAKRPGWALAATYFLVLTAAAYTQPYSVTVGFAHVIWSVACRERRTAAFGATALAATILAFLPWYLWSKGRWAAGLEPYGVHFSASMKTPLMLFRELTGAGYWGAGLLLILCAMALADGGGLARRTKVLLLLLIATPLASVFAADAVLDYFLAARQFIWVLPAIALLAGSAERRTPAGPALIVLLGAVCTWQSIRYFTAPHENWQAAADAIQARTQPGACFAVAPPEQVFLYEYFHPDLRRRPCDRTQMVLAMTPYSTRKQQSGALSAFESYGYRRESERFVGGTTLVEFRHPPVP